jgi:4-hydroxybenzoate polyprenyltransferase
MDQPNQLAEAIVRPVDGSDLPPLCVDLDGTILNSDCLWETFFHQLPRDPLLLFKSGFWLVFGGRPRLKRELAKLVELDPEILPYNLEVVEFLKRQKLKGQRLILVTASDELVARAIASHLGVFNEVCGSDGVVNLKGEVKAQFLVGRFGVEGYDYVGDSASDLPVWMQAKTAYLVRPCTRVKATIAARRGRTIVLDGRVSALRAPLWRALRPHQWLKNLLLFVPLLAAHQWASLEGWLKLGQFFVAFSLTASSVYLLNDLADLDSDRRHSLKKNRPMAAGNLPLIWGLVACGVSLSAGLLLGAFLGGGAFGLLVGYLGSTALYSFSLKRRLALDVIVLALLYTFRIAGGAVVAEVVLSPWLLAFSMFLFLSLATAKRYSELWNQQREGGSSNQARGYRQEDLPQLNVLGASSGYLAVLVLALYINSEHIAELYRRPLAAWALLPILLYWISRLWLLTNRGQLNEDPVLFALKDKVSYVVVLLIVIIGILAGPR